jgi:peptidyl-tRNA hydrolase, PTH1 family
MKMIVGLGNPGPRYKNTRHNIGFLVLDDLAQVLGACLDREKNQGLVSEIKIGTGKVLLVKPLTFMNLSGTCVADMARNKVTDPANILVIADDVNLRLGQLRFRSSGSAGGHNGLKSVIERLGSDAFHRLRLGVGAKQSGQDLADHVLSRFDPDEWPFVTEMLPRAVEAAQCWLTDGIETCMNRYNDRGNSSREGRNSVDQ